VLGHKSEIKEEWGIIMLSANAPMDHGYGVPLLTTGS